MSIAQGTTHYNYPQVQLNDRPTFADFNPAFEDIDAKLYSLITGASTDHSAIESLQTGLGETNLLLASVKQTADSASGKADTNAENITLLQTGLGNTDRTVANKLDSVAIAEPYDAAAGTYAIGDIVVYNGQRYKCTTAVAVAEPFDADKWTGEDVETVLEHLQDEIDNIPTPTVTAADVDITPITGMTATQTQQALEELHGDLVVTTGTTTDQYVNYIKVGKLVIVSFNLRSATGSSTPTWTEVATLPINVAEAQAAGTSASGKSPLVRVSGNKAYVMTSNTTDEAVSGQVVTYIA